jgi:cysteine desulfurase/selenocysteine lyase
VAGAIGLKAAIDFLQNTGLKEVGEYEHELAKYALNKFAETENIRIFAPKAERSAVISFLINGVHPFDSGTLLDKLGIAIRTGTHCAEPLMKYLNITGTMRISFALYNTIEEIDYFFESLNKVKLIFE